MDFFTSQLIPQPSHEDSQASHDEGLGTEEDISTEQSCTSMTQIGEQQISSRIDNISRTARMLLEKLNDSRAHNLTLIGSFEENLVGKVTDICEQMKEHIYRVYKENNHKMQAQFQELSEVLENCSKLNEELLGVNQALKSLREGLVLGQTPKK